MNPALACAVSLALLAGPAAAAGPFYARGAYYAGSGAPWDYDAGNQLHDDGLHGDGAAGDGVYAASVVADQGAGIYGFKIANADWSELYPHQPFFPLSNARVAIEGPGDVVFFRLDTNAEPDGWIPASNAVATDQPAPPGVSYEVIGSAPETGAWTSGVPAPQVDSFLVAEIPIANPGAYAFKFRVVGTWDVCNFGAHYNMHDGDDFAYVTEKPGAIVRFEMNLRTGRGRALELPPSPVEATTWGRIKGAYR